MLTSWESACRWARCRSSVDSMPFSPPGMLFSGSSQSEALGSDKCHLSQLPLLMAGICLESPSYLHLRHSVFPNILGTELLPCVDVGDRQSGRLLGGDSSLSAQHRAWHIGGILEQMLQHGGSWSGPSQGKLRESWPRGWACGWCPEGE